MDNKKIYEALRTIQRACYEHIDAMKSDIYTSISEKFMQGEISEEEFVEQYNRLVEQEAEKHWEPVEPHEHI